MMDYHIPDSLLTVSDYVWDYLLLNTEMESRVTMVQYIQHYSVDKERPLYNEGGHKQVYSKRSVAITFQKCHQETKPDKDHHMDILEG